VGKFLENLLSLELN